MKEFKLSAWPELPAGTQPHRLPPHAERHVASLCRRASADRVQRTARSEVRQFLELLDASGVLQERDRAANDSLFDSLRPLGGWLRRTFAEEPQRS